MPENKGVSMTLRPLSNASTQPPREAGHRSPDPAIVGRWPVGGRERGLVDSRKWSILRRPPRGYALNAKTNPRSCLESIRVRKNEPRTNLNEPKTNPDPINEGGCKPFRISARSNCASYAPKPGGSAAEWAIGKSQFGATPRGVCPKCKNEPEKLFRINKSKKKRT